MFEHLTPLSVWISEFIGITIGIVLVLYKRFPKTDRGLLTVFILLLLSPSIGRDVFIVADATSGTMTGWAMSPFLYGICLVLVTVGVIHRARHVNSIIM